MPRPADTEPEQNHQEWHSAGGEIKVRPRIFERTLQILRNFCCTPNGLLRSCTYEKVFLWCPSESRLRPVSPKRSNCVLHGSKGYLRAHLAFQALITSSELEIVLSELWLHFFFKKLFIWGAYSGVIYVWTPPPGVEEKQRVQLLGMASALLQTKCWDVDVWHIVELGELIILYWFLYNRV